DDPTVPSLDHLRQYCLTAQDQPNYVDVENVLPVLADQVPDRQVASLPAGDAGVVHEDVGGAELGFDLRDNPGNVRLLGDVADGRQATDLLRHARRGFGRQVKSPDPGPGGGQSAANGLADPLAAARDHGHPTVEPEERLSHAGLLVETV